ncbi:Non-specific serine/threonine protein kinase [Bertholletia excelsa]
MRLLSLFLLELAYFAPLLVPCDGVATNEFYALSKFKEAIFEDPVVALATWNTLDADPCDWAGISCSMARDRVLKLNISWSFLRGFIAPELGLLSSLQELILHGNNLVGTVPKEIGMLKDLKVLDLGENQLSGPIPRELGNLTGLMKIDFQSNVLTGTVPPELGNLKYLEELRLNKNKLGGTVPGSNSSFRSGIHGMYASNGNISGFCHSSQLKVADFSHNFFVGSIPKCLEYLPRSSFQENCLEDKDPKQRPATQCNAAPPAESHSGFYSNHQPARDVHQASSKSSSGSRPTWLLALEIVTGSIGGSLFIIASLATFRRCKSRSSIIIPWKKSASDRDHMAVYIDSELLRDVWRFSRQELEVACEDFSNIIGSSPENVIYKGTMKGGSEIAVIHPCIKEEHWTGYLELYFQREAAELARLNHENTGKLLGYCIENNPFTRMLVFEYASNGTLHEHLHYGEGCHLSWTRRMRIIIGIARGLKYLHTEINPPFTVSRLDSNAIYLTEDFSPQLVDFGSWNSIFSKSENSSSIGNYSTFCVLSNPVEARHVDIKENIYAFGVLLLEIVSGRPPYCKDKGCLVAWAKDLIDMPEVMSYVVDPELKHFRYNDLQVICEAVTLCIDPNPSKRASMKELCSMLEGRIDTSVSVEVKASSLAWAELALSSSEFAANTQL